MLKEIIKTFFGNTEDKTDKKEVHFTKKENAKTLFIFLIASILCCFFDAYYLLIFAVFGVFYFLYKWLLS